MLALGSLEVFDLPFPYFTADGIFGPDVSRAVLEWLEREPRWELTEADFYEQYEFNLLDVPPPRSLSFLTGEPFQDDLRNQLEQVFGERLTGRVDCTVHKLVSGQRIRVHNDFIPGSETHRLVIQLNRGWRQDHGGFLMLFNSADAADIHAVLAPVHDSVVGFAISEASYHAVSTVHSGQRYTLVYSFYRDDVS